MGSISNTARHITTGITKHSLGARASGCGIASNVRPNAAAIRNFSVNARNNLTNGSKATPIVNECKNITEGIAKGDFTKATVNTGMLAMTATLAGTSGAAKTGTSKFTPSFVAGMSMGMIPFTETLKSTPENIGQHVQLNQNSTPVTTFQNAAQMAVAPEIKSATPTVTYRVYKAKDQKRQRSASPGSMRRMSSGTRNLNHEQWASGKKPFMMAPYFKDLTQNSKKEQFQSKESKGLCMSFHNYKPLI